MFLASVGCGSSTGPFPADDVEVDGEDGLTDDADPDVPTPEDVGPDAEDVGLEDVVDTGVDADVSDDGDTSPPDEELNACGTVGELPVTIDGPCGVCGDGVWSCDDEDADDEGEGTAGVSCSGATSPNACGGCATLDAAPGEACDVDGTAGMTACVGTELVTCAAGASNTCGGTEVLMLDGESVEPGDACALPCGEGVVVCDDDDTVTCEEVGTSAPPNVCGGCGLLAGVPGDACGDCALWTCDDGAVTCTEESTLPGCGTGQTCATLDCGAQNRSCMEGSGGSEAVCEDCLEGYDERGGECVLIATCAALECSAENRSCTEGAGGSNAVCGACLEGHLEDGGACRAIVTCSDLDCGAAHRSCTASTAVADAVCGACVEGYLEDGGACRAIVTCSDLDCGAAHRSCTASTTVADAVCGACVEGYDDRGGTCVLIVTCAALDCGAQNRLCSEGSGGADATCGGCFEDLLEEDGTCVLPLVAMCDDSIPCANGAWCPTETSIRRCSPRPEVGGVGIPFHFVPSGTFSLGSPVGEVGRGSNEDQVSVTLVHGMYVGRTEVTHGQWRAVMQAWNALPDAERVMPGWSDVSPVFGTEPSYFGSSGAGGCETSDCPVERVSWWDAVVYANALSILEGLEPCYTLTECGTGTGVAGVGGGCGGTALSCVSPFSCTDVTFAEGFACTGYRLPTEAEWEFAARGGTSTATYLGNLSGLATDCVNAQPNLDSIAWWCLNSASRTHTVGGNGGNAWGLYDMLGNVWEWTWSWFADAHTSDPLGAASGNLRVLRGGSFANPASSSRAATRITTTPVERYRNLGFRLVRTAPPACAVDADCAEGYWCPTETRSRVCSPRPAVGGVEMLFNHVPPGSFLIGSPVTESGRFSDEGQVSVAITHGSYMGRTEVSQGQWRAVMEAWNALPEAERVMSGWSGATPVFGTEPSYFGSLGAGGCTTPDCPLERVSWWDAVVYANALSILEGLTPCYTLTGCGSGTGVAGVGGGCAGTSTLCLSAFSCSSVTFAEGFACTGYRLPTEAEWEFAARGRTSTATYGGDLSGTSGCVTLSGAGGFVPGTPFADLAWYNCNSGNRTQPVAGAEKSPNASGLYDMLGNVWEWTWSWYAATHTSDPLGAASGSFRGLRGGSWNSDASLARAARRSRNDPAARSYNFGFRLARTAPEP